MSIEFKGILEIDQERGVIYFHSIDTGGSLLRICRLPKPIPNPLHGSMPEMLDITHMHGTSWEGSKFQIPETEVKKDERSKRKH